MLKYLGIVLLWLFDGKKSLGETEPDREREVVRKKAISHCVDVLNQQPAQPISSQSTAALNESLR